MRLCWCGLLLSMLAGTVAAQSAPDDGEKYAIHLRPQRLVEIEPGRRLNLVCIGEGTPTVVFESGLADPTSLWFRIQPDIAKHTRACSYDRAGAGFSDAPTRDGTSANLVDDLKRLLDAAGIKPPYVLVAHSSGGMNARLYYYSHPNDVAAMVLVDPSHEDQGEGYRMLSPRGLTREQWQALGLESLANRRRCIEHAAAGFVVDSEPYRDCIFPPPTQLPPALQRAYLDMQLRPAFHQAQLTEEEHLFGASAQQLSAARRAFVDLPLVVLTQAPDPTPLRDWETPRLRAARTRMWFNLHQSLADSSARGAHRVVPDSDHSIHLSQPQAVIEAVNEMIDVARQSPARKSKSD